jgi:hypothetical protein
MERRSRARVAAPTSPLAPNRGTEPGLF